MKGFVKEQVFLLGECEIWVGEVWDEGLLLGAGVLVGWVWDLWDLLDEGFVKEQVFLAR